MKYKADIYPINVRRSDLSEILRYYALPALKQSAIQSVSRPEY